MRRPASIERGETGGRGRRVLPLLDVLGRGAEQDVAVDGRGHQDALRPRRGHRQQNGRDERARQLVEDDELTPARRDGELPVAEPLVHLVGEKPGRVHDPVAAEAPPGRLQEPASRVALVAHAGDRGAQSQLHAGADGFGGERDAGTPGADDRLVGNDDGAGGSWSEVRFASSELLDGELGHAGVAVGSGLGDHVAQPGLLLLVPRHQDRPRLFERDARRPRVGGRAARGPAGPAPTPGCSAQYRSRCAQWPCSLWTCRFPRRRPARGSPCAAGSAPVGGPGRCRPPRHR